MLTRTRKKTLATAGASLALVAAMVGAGLSTPAGAAWAAGNVPGVEQMQQASPSPVPKPGPRGERQGGPRGGDMQQAYQDALAGRLGVTSDQLKEAMKLARIDLVNKAVADGKLDQERANRMIEAIQNGRGPGQPGVRDSGKGPRGEQGTHRGGPGQRGHGPGGPGARAQGGPSVVADALGLTPQQLRTEMQAGKSLAQVAEAHGVSRDTLKAKLLEAHKTRIDAAVAAGKLTAEQAQKMTDRAAAQIDAMLDRVPGQRPGPRTPKPDA